MSTTYLFIKLTLNQLSDSYQEPRSDLKVGGGGGYSRVKGEELGSGALSLKKFSTRASFRSKKRLFWKPLSHAHPMLVVKNSQYKFQGSRPNEIFEEKLKKNRTSSLWLL